MVLKTIKNIKPNWKNQTSELSIFIKYLLLDWKIYVLGKC